MIDMRNIALTFLGCFTILAACSNSDDAEKPVAPIPTGDVTIYATTSSLTRDLTRDAVNFSSKDNLAPTSITLNPTEQYQTMDGFGFAGLRGSEANDAFRMTAEGAVVTATNHNAGINGGITNGMPVVFRTAVKPTPSIYKEQETVDYIAKQDAPLSIQGRHDPCIVPRAAIVQTCAAALAVGDLMTARYGTAWMERPTSYRREGL